MRASWLLVLIGCGNGQVAQSAEALTDAELDPSHPAIGRYLFRQGERSSSCTATLVGTQTVLTAAHCVGYPEAEIELGEPPQRYPVARDLAHPEWRDSRAWAHDLGLVFLSASTGISPIPVELRAPIPGEGVTLVGYGETALNAADNGQRRRAQNDVASLEDLYLVIEGTGGGVGNACRGDSGGPVLTQNGGPEAVLGVLSYVPNLGQRCGDASWAVRLDRYEDWLTSEAGSDLARVDRGEPELRIVSPAPGEALTSPVPIEVYARDDRGRARLTIWVDGAVVSEGSTLSYVAGPDLPLGPHVLEARVSDEAGRSAQARVAFTVVEGVAAPEAASGCRDTGGRAPSGPAGLGLLALLIWNGFRRRPTDVACRWVRSCLPRRHAYVDRDDHHPRRPRLWRRAPK